MMKKKIPIQVEKLGQLAVEEDGEQMQG